MLFRSNVELARVQVRDLRSGQRREVRRAAPLSDPRQQRGSRRRTETWWGALHQRWVMVPVQESTHLFSTPASTDSSIAPARLAHARPSAGPRADGGWNSGAPLSLGGIGALLRCCWWGAGCAEASCRKSDAEPCEVTSAAAQSGEPWGWRDGWGLPEFAFCCCLSLHHFTTSLVRILSLEP